MNAVFFKNEADTIMPFPTMMHFLHLLDLHNEILKQQNFHQLYQSKLPVQYYELHLGQPQHPFKELI